jgi:hypothetical protein
MYSENLSVSEVKANMFDKRTVVELNEGQMVGVDGGSTWLCGAAVVAAGAALIDATVNLYNAFHDSPDKCGAGN